MESKILYVDKITTNVKFSFTKSYQAIYRNIETIKGKEALHEMLSKLAQTNNHAFVMVAGRFIVIVSMSLDENDNNMVLLDLENNEIEAKKQAAAFQDQKIYSAIMEHFDSLRTTYERDYYEYSLQIISR